VKISLTKAYNDTMHRQKTAQWFTANVKQTLLKRPDTLTPSGGWLGLSAEEGRGQPRKSPGYAHAAVDPGIPEWDFLLWFFGTVVLH
jgi:hypothetical protein